MSIPLAPGIDQGTPTSGAGSSGAMTRSRGPVAGFGASLVPRQRGGGSRLWEAKVNAWGAALRMLSGRVVGAEGFGGVDQRVVGVDRCFEQEQPGGLRLRDLGAKAATSATPTLRRLWAGDVTALRAVIRHWARSAHRIARCARIAT